MTDITALAPELDLDPAEHQPGRIQAFALLASRPIGIYLASRVVVVIAMWFASRLSPRHSVAAIASFWDGAWYLHAAKDGYSAILPAGVNDAGQSTHAFFPLYPFCMRVVHSIGFSYVEAGLIVATTAGAVAALLLWFLLRRMWGAEAADRGVALFCFFPGAYVLSMVYSESLTLAFAVGCLLALLSGRWTLAGVLGALATATRPNALALVPACAWAAAVAIRQRREWRALIAPFLAPMGFVAFQVFLWARTGNADAWMRTQRRGWDNRMVVSAPWDKIREFIRHPLVDMNLAVTVAGIVILAVALVLLFTRVRLPGPLIVYTLGLAVLMLVSQNYGARPRFIMTAFPLVTAPARWLRGNAFMGVLACSAALLGAFVVGISLTVP